MSEFVFLFRATDSARQAAMGTPESAQRSMQAWLAWIRDLEADGHLKHPGQPLDVTGKVVRGQHKIVTDGPYAETKEQLGGILVLEARDMNHAVQLIGQHPALTYGNIFEIRPAADMNEVMKASEQRRRKDT